MPPTPGPRNSSSSSNSSVGASYHLVLEHLLSSPGSYELPLQTMYSVNSGATSKLSTPEITRSNRPRACTSPPGSTPLISPSDDAPDASQAAAAHIISSLMNHVSTLPSQSCSISPSFIISFVRRCFPLELELVDFPQSLTALDLLKDFESKRKRDVTAAFSRVGYERNLPEYEAQRMSLKHPGVVKWAGAVMIREDKIQRLYQQVYIVLRRWILINEMSLVPFNKHNALAMLNTLYPPGQTDASFSPLPPHVMASQREAYFRYVQRVERKGCVVLETLMQYGKPQGSGDTTGWPSVSRTIDCYLRAASGLMEESFEVTCLKDFDSNGLKSSRITGLRRRKETDSGVSISSEYVNRPQTSRSVSSSIGPEIPTTTPPRQIATNKYKILPQTPAISTPRRAVKPAAPFNPTPPLSKDANAARSEPLRRFSALEKIARELRKIKDRRKLDSRNVKDSFEGEDSGLSTGASSMATSPASTFSSSSSANKLRRLRSLGDIKEKSTGISATGSLGAETFDAEDMKKKCLAWQANARQELARGSQKIGVSFEV